MRKKKYKENILQKDTIMCTLRECEEKINLSMHKSLPDIIK